MIISIFNSIISHSADVSFRQTITHGCLCKLLAWAKAKKQSNKSSVGNTDELPSDLTGIAHAVIKTIHTCGASSSSDPLLQLKSTLPAFCTLNRSVTRALAAGNANCCLIAQCLYEPSGALQTSTPAERKRASRQNVELHHSQQSLDSSRRKIRRQDSSYRQQELTRQREHNCANTTQLVSRFRSIIQSGPVFVCTSCDQLFYKHSVQTAKSIRSLSLPITGTVLLGKISSDGNEYICQTCAKYIRQNKIPPCSIANNLQFPTANSTISFTHT